MRRQRLFLAGPRPRPWLVVALAVVASLNGCTQPIDTTRVVPRRGTLGVEIYKVFCQRVAARAYPTDVSGARSLALCEGRAAPGASTPPDLTALANNRDRLVDALDHVLPDSVQDDLQHFLVQLLPLYDPPEDQLPQQTRAVADLLGRLADDDDAIAALERMSTRRGYRPIRLAMGIGRPLLAYEGFDDFARRTLSAIDDSGSAAHEWDDLLATMALDMATARDPEPRTSEPTTLALTRRLLLTQNRAFGTATSRWVVARDPRGIVLPSTESGSMPDPFYDDDGDGLADVDALGRFVAPGGGLLDVPTPFAVLDEAGVPRDSSGRALRSDGTRYYAYFDADTTLLGGLMRETHDLFDPDMPAILDLAYGAPALFGPRVPKTAEFGAATLDYTGYDTSTGALFDLLHAAGTVLHRPETDDALAVADILARDHESVLAGVIAAGWQTDAAADAHPEAALEQPSVFWDDMLEVAEAMAQTPGLTEAMLRALADPRTANAGYVFGKMMRYKDRIDFNPGDVNGPPIGDFRTPVDRSRPDRADNQSLFQRSLSLVHDLNGVRLCNKAGAVLHVYVGGVSVLRWPLTRSYAECELLQIDNVAELYAEAVAGRAHIQLKDTTLDGLLRAAQSLGILSIDQLLQQQSGISGLTQTPTPQALARLVFAPRNAFLRNLVDPPLTRDGALVEDRHAGTMLAWEKSILLPDGTRTTFLQVMAPLISAFVARDPAGGRFLFGDLHTVQHTHWGSRYEGSDATTQNEDPDAPFYSHQSNIRSYEEILAEAFDQAEMLMRLHELAVTLDGVEVRPGVDGIDALAAATEVLLDPTRSCPGGECAPGEGRSLAYRNGRHYSCANDGACFTDARGQPTRYVSPMYLLVDALKAIDVAFESEPDRLVRWREGRGSLVRQLFGTRVTGTGFALTNRRAHAALLTLVPFLRERVAAHRADGDLEEWATTLGPRAEESLASPVAVSIVAFLEAMQNEPDSREALSRLVQYLLDEGGLNDAFDTTLVAVADLLQVLDDDRNVVPLVRALADGIAPNARSVVARGGTVELEGSALSETLELLRAIHDVDDRGTMKQITANLVAMSSEGGDMTALETIVDVVAEVNRASPGAGGSLDAADYRKVLGAARDFMNDDVRGLERMYRIVQERTID